MDIFPKKIRESTVVFTRMLAFVTHVRQLHGLVILDFFFESLEKIETSRESYHF